MNYKQVLPTDVHFINICIIIQEHERDVVRAGGVAGADNVRRVHNSLHVRQGFVEWPVLHVFKLFEIFHSGLDWYFVSLIRPDTFLRENVF